MNDLPPISDLTPEMGSEERVQSQELSLRRLRPPLRVVGYEQEQFMGRGAFGEVWSAIDSNSGRRVAIKFYSRRGALDWANMAREVEKLRFLFTDRYVVQLLAVGWEANPPYFVMEYMPFGSLGDLTARGPLALEEAVKLFREIAVGLSHAHGKGILHCDLKPSNIMIDQDGWPRLADFGQSRLSHEQMPSLGTFFYMAPEQAEPRAMPDVRWDVYALGAILYQMLTGKAPHQTEESLAKLSSQDTIRNRLEAYSSLLQAAPKPTDHHHAPGVDAALAAIVDRCLSANPSHRFSNVQAVLDALKQRETRRAQRPMLLVGALGPALVVLVLMGISAWMFHEVLSGTERKLVDLTLESNSFAAHLVATRFALEIEKRWHILEGETGEPILQQSLARSGERVAKEPQPALQSWIEGRRKYWNTQFSAKTAAAYWFVLDDDGYLRAISPPAPDLIGRYFGYRDYFHGMGDERDRHAARQPIRQPHRSNVFHSLPANVISVAFSVPIYPEGKAGDPLGVLVMEADLGHFAEFMGSRNEFASIVDLRPDADGKAGLIAEHPELYERPAESRRYYVDAAMLEALEKLRAEHAAEDHGDKTPAAAASPANRSDDVFRNYSDPLFPQEGDNWLCAAEPVFVPRGGGRKYDAGWTILVEEKRSGRLAPLQSLWIYVVTRGLCALGLVVLILTALWGYVLMRLHAGDGITRYFRRLTRAPETPSLSLSARSEGSSELSERPDEKLSGGATHG